MLRQRFSTVKPSVMFGSPTLQDARAGIYELLGTTLFLFFALLGCQTASTVSSTEADGGSALDRMQYCATSFGVSLFVLASIFFRLVISIPD